ncbi:MAG: CaiB/BaiF CoA transferase family protein [Promethearchaeota archaeon]
MVLPIDGIRVVDLSRMLPGPYCSMILSDLGAEVIRVEDSKYTYSSPPPFYQKGRYRESAFNSILMRNKKSITLNLKNEKARDIFYNLIKTADVIIETFRPGVTRKLKIDYHSLSQINKAIIYCSLSGYGQEGPYKKIAGHDLNYVGLCGILNLNRERKVLGIDKKERIPIVPGLQAADIGGALISVIGILGALIEREKNPKKIGQYIDISMLDSVFSFIPMVAAHQFSKENYEGIKTENLLQGDFPFYSVYKTKDNKYISLGIVEFKFWNELCDILNRADLKLKQMARGLEREKVFNQLQKEFLKKNRDDWFEILKERDVCVMPVKNFEEACQDPQILHRKMIVEMEHPKLGKIKNISSPIKYSRTPLEIRSLAPKKGQDTREILLSLGYSELEIQNFKKNSVL